MLLLHSVHSVSASAGGGTAVTTSAAANGASATDARCARREVDAVSVGADARVVVVFRDFAACVFANPSFDATRRVGADAAHTDGVTTRARISVFMVAGKWDLGYKERRCVGSARAEVCGFGAGAARKLTGFVISFRSTTWPFFGTPCRARIRSPHQSSTRAMGSIIGKITEELPKHEVLTKTASYEIRRYAPCVVAETGFTSKKGMFEGDQGKSFMKLASFIGVMTTPKNDVASPIAMTAPVLMHKGKGDESFTMAFFLPASRFAKASHVPVPTDANVTIKDVPARTVAVHTFSGNMRAEVISVKDKELREALARDGVKTKKNAEVMAAGYNPPWTPWFLKTNEVLLEVER